MPIGLAQDPQVDLDRLDAGAATLPVPQSAGLGAAFDSAREMTDRALHFTAQRQINQSDPLQFDAAPNVGQPMISAEEANSRFGIEGVKRFNAPTTEDDAAWQGAMARRNLLDSTILARSNANPLLTFGAGLAGALTDPLGLSTMLATGGLGDAAVGAIGLRGAEEAGATGLALTKLGRLANAGRAVGAPLVAGAVDNIPYVGVNAAVTNATGDDYSLGDGLRDIAAGAVLHTTVHLATRAAADILGRFRAGPGDPAGSTPANAFEPNPAPASGVPESVDALPETARQGAFAMALDQMADDRPVDVGRHVERELTPDSLGRLDERSAAPQIDSWRPLEPDTAVTQRGTEIPVRYGLAELSDLATSHDDNLSVNPAYPTELQPRARDRAGAMARNYQLEKELNPRLLMNDVGAGSGAPIVAPDGVVESGNGRTIALRRSAASGGEAYTRYRAALDAAGFDATGMDKPALVRMREEPLTGGARAILAREMNADVTERMGAGEQAQADAARINDASFDHVGDGQTPWGSRDFARDFIARAAPDQVNVLANADGSLSPEGVRRIKAAVLARAYGDPRLVGQIFEDEASDARKLGEALAEAAAAWARLRAAAAAGAIPREMDLTDNLTGAMDLVRFAKAEGRPLGQIVAELLGQGDMFSGSALSPATEALLRMMFRDAEFKKPTAAAKVAAALKDYARQALKVVPGENLFGETAGEDTARQILGNAAEKFGQFSKGEWGDAGDIDIVRPPGPSRGEPGSSPAVLDLAGPGGERDGGGSGLSPDGGAKPEADGGGDGGSTKPQRVTADQMIAADPELRDLLAETERLEQANGIEPKVPETEDPNTLAEAVRAAAVCLAEEAS